MKKTKKTKITEIVRTISNSFNKYLGKLTPYTIVDYLSRCICLLGIGNTIGYVLYTMVMTHSNLDVEGSVSFEWCLMIIIALHSLYLLDCNKKEYLLAKPKVNYFSSGFTTNISSWNTSSIVNMNHIFGNVQTLSQPLSGWNMNMWKNNKNTTKKGP